MQSLAGNWSHYGNWSLSVKLHFYKTNHLPEGNYFPDYNHLPEIGHLLEIGRIIVQSINHITLYFQLLWHFGAIIGPEVRFLAKKRQNFLKRRLRRRFRALRVRKPATLTPPWGQNLATLTPPWGRKRKVVRGSESGKKHPALYNNSKNGNFVAILL